MYQEQHKVYVWDDAQHGIGHWELRNGPPPDGLARFFSDDSKSRHEEKAARRKAVEVQVKEGKAAAQEQQDRYYFGFPSDFDIKGKSSAWQSGYEDQWQLFHRQMSRFIAEKLRDGSEIDPDARLELRRIYTDQIRRWMELDPLRAIHFRKRMGKDLLVDEDPLPAPNGEEAVKFLNKHIFDDLRAAGKPLIGERKYTKQEKRETRAPATNFAITAAKWFGPPVLVAGLLFGNYNQNNVPTPATSDDIAAARGREITEIKVQKSPNGKCTFDKAMVSLSDGDLVRFVTDEPAQLEFSIDMPLVLPDRHMKFGVNGSALMKMNFSSDSDASRAKRRTISCETPGGDGMGRSLRIYQDRVVN